jgi:hypothetical protein
MAKKATYRDYLKQEMSELIENIDLPQLQKRFMKSRWLDQVLWLEGRATSARNRHYTLRLITIIGGVIVPALVSANSASVRDFKFKEFFGWTAFGLSQAVAISAAVEELFHFGENYRRYRNTAEGMKIEGWHFFQLSGPYKGFTSHTEAYASFATHVEEIIQKDVEGYISQTKQEDTESKAATDATIAQNVALTELLREQLQHPSAPGVAQLPSDSTPQSSQPSAGEAESKEGENKDFVTPDPIQGSQLREVSNQESTGSTSALTNLPPSVPNSPSVIKPDKGEDESLQTKSE